MIIQPGGNRFNQDYIQNRIEIIPTFWENDLYRASKKGINVQLFGKKIIVTILQCNEYKHSFLSYTLGCGLF